LIRAAGATPAGVLIALDRQERGQGELSAVQEVQRDYGIPVIAVAGLSDLMSFLAHHPEFAAHSDAVTRYREQYGIHA
jgi:orotate phosphoribosyltransferase